MGIRTLLAVGVLALLQLTAAYYVPGTYPQEFLKGDKIQANVNSLTSFETELPFDYYSLPFCTPPEGVRRIANTANLGTIMMGTRIENSVFNFTIMEKETGVLGCKPTGYIELTKNDVKALRHKIDNKYRVNMILDNLPVTVYDLQDENQDIPIRSGFELGYKEYVKSEEKGKKPVAKYYINNHLVFNILVHATSGEYTRARQAYKDAAVMGALDARKLLGLSSQERQLGEAEEAAKGKKGAPAKDAKAAAAKATDQAAPKVAAKPTTSAEKKKAVANGAKLDESMYMVVGFEVSPCSIAREAGREIQYVPSCMEADSKVSRQEIKEGAKVVYTYDVFWQVSKIKWASRWDAYLRAPGGKVHWFSILNSILIVLVMATLVAMILIRTVRRDLARYEQLVVDSNDLKDEAGWKLVSGDVFRAPTESQILCVFVGSGVQITLTAVVSLFLAALGFLSPASRGALITTTMVMYVVLGFTAGFACVYLWGTLERSYAGWPTVCARVSIFYPGVVMVIYTVLNLLITHTGALGAVPIKTYLSLLASWVFISIPLTFAGGLLATRRPIIDYPVKTNQIPRHIPPPPVVAHPILLFFSAGILPFGTMFIELYFAMTSLWGGYFYYLFGFVFIIGALTVIINAEISVLCTYVQLCAEDYLWWWRSFQRGGSVAVYITLYALGFLVSTLHNLAGFVPVFLYLSYMAILILGAYLMLGTIGFAASFWFVYQIFAAVKAD